MPVLSESVGFLPENGRFSCESMGNQAGKCTGFRAGLVFFDSR